ncbi:MAG TPA: dihydroorotase [Thermoanaerobaculia bacterium]|nr:dihydroorotase [Thermoanaerobaculia bacterium]
MRLLIRGGRVVDPSQGLDDRKDVLIEEGLVTKVASSIKPPSGIETLDAAGMVVSPGFIDLHTHLREPGQEHKETIRSGTLAAVAGGFTAVCAMANTVPPNDERAVTEMIIAESQRNGACRVYPIGAVSRGLRGEELAEMADLSTGGCVAFSDDGKPVINAQLMRRALEYAGMLGRPVVAHEQDLNLTEGAAMHEGYYSTLLGLRGMPAAAEEMMVARDVVIAELTGGHLHIAHLSTRGAVEAVRRAKQKGLRVTCEVAPHHFALTDEAVQSFSTNLKMNPPLRSEEHRAALLEALADGTIDAIATDHAPHHFDEKNVEFDLAPFGITGLETAFAVSYDRLVHSKIVGISRLIELLSVAPARIFSLPGGTLAGGSPGDVTIFDPDGETSVEHFVSKASNSPFTGSTFRGRIIATVVGGAIRYDGRTTGGNRASEDVPSNSAHKRRSKS